MPRFVTPADLVGQPASDGQPFVEGEVRSLPMGEIHALALHPDVDGEALLAAVREYRETESTDAEPRNRRTLPTP